MVYTDFLVSYFQTGSWVRLQVVWDQGRIARMPLPRGISSLPWKSRARLTDHVWLAFFVSEWTAGRRVKKLCLVLCVLVLLFQSSPPDRGVFINFATESYKQWDLLVFVSCWIEVMKDSSCHTKYRTAFVGSLLGVFTLWCFAEILSMCVFITIHITTEPTISYYIFQWYIMDPS